MHPERAIWIACLLLAGCGGPAAVDAEAPTPEIVEVAPPGTLQVGFLVVDGVYNTELTAPYDLFHHTRFHADPGMRVFTISPDGGPVKTFEGLRLTPDFGIADAPPIDILVVPSAEGSMDRDLENETMIDWVRDVGSRARFVVSLCDGAFVLATAGLLDGHACTTFPGDQDRFAEQYPRLDLRREVSFVHDRRILTSEGGARSFDVALYLIAHIYGDEVAGNVGRGLVLAWPPPEAAGIRWTVATRSSSGE